MTPPPMNRLHLALPLLVCALAFSCGELAEDDSTDKDADDADSSGGTSSVGGAESATGGRANSTGGTSSGGSGGSGGSGEPYEEFNLACQAATSASACEAVMYEFSGICVDCSGFCAWGRTSELSQQFPQEHVYQPRSGDAQGVALGGMGGAEEENPACYLIVGDGG